MALITVDVMSYKIRLKSTNQIRHRFNRIQPAFVFGTAMMTLCFPTLSYVCTSSICSPALLKRVTHSSRLRSRPPSEEDIVRSMNAHYHGTFVSGITTLSITIRDSDVRAGTTF